MGESIDDSSNAAQRAQPQRHDDEDETGGFFRRIIGALSPGEADADDEMQSADKSRGDLPGIVNLRRWSWRT